MPAPTSFFRFRLYTAESVGAYICLPAASQAEAMAELTKQLCSWEKAVPLHGPSQCRQWFTI